MASASAARALSRTTLPIDETHPTWPEDSYSFTNRAGEDLLATCTHAYGIRTYVTRIAGIFPSDAAPGMPRASPRPQRGTRGCGPWVGGEDVAAAHRALLAAADNLPPHDVYFLNADDTLALEPTLELVERFHPDLLPVVRNLAGHTSLMTCNKLKSATGWRHQTTWREA